MAYEVTEMKGQVLGTKANGETKKIIVDDNGYMKVNVAVGGSAVMQATNPSDATTLVRADDYGNLMVTPSVRISSAPTTGTKTVTAVAASIFAGGSALANRNFMMVSNVSANTVYWGGSGVTTSSGIPLLPGDSMTFVFKKTTATDIYFIAGTNSEVRVVEWA